MVVVPAGTPYAEQIRLAAAWSVQISAVPQAADQVDWDTDPTTITIRLVVTRYGLREWPKSRESNRVVPVPGHLRDELWQLVADRPHDTLLSPAPRRSARRRGRIRLLCEALRCCRCRHLS